MSKPTDDQLVNFVHVIISKYVMYPNKQLIKLMLRESPELRNKWLKRHAEYQKNIDEI